tara:strand:+ start:2891 stop:3289 length:399 start_codon:yes stop_codon:yes gene_type:complete
MINLITKLFVFIAILIINFNSITLSTNAISKDQFSERITELENKFSRNFANKFCNSMGFGLSEDSSWKFAVGENNKEIQRNKLYNQIDIKDMEVKTANLIYEKCGSLVNVNSRKNIDVLIKKVTERKVFNMK